MVTEKVQPFLEVYNRRAGAVDAGCDEINTVKIQDDLYSEGNQALEQALREVVGSPCLDILNTYLDKALSSLTFIQS